MNKNQIVKELSVLIDQYYEIQTPIKDHKVAISTTCYDSSEIKKALQALLSGWISQGKNVKEFEKSFSKKNFIHWPKIS